MFSSSVCKNSNRKSEISEMNLYLYDLNNNVIRRHKPELLVQFHYEAKVFNVNKETTLRRLIKVK